MSDLPLKKSEVAAELSDLLSAGSTICQDEPMAHRTTLRVGGPADVFVEPADEKDLAETIRFCGKARIPHFILGRGSNLLVRDGGIRGVVICLAKDFFSRIQVDGVKITCGVGARLKNVANEARRHGVGGFEFLEGIPGGVGGALRMNAGAMGGAVFDLVLTVRFMDETGAVFEREKAFLEPHYRSCDFLKSRIALSAVLTGNVARTDEIAARMKEFSLKRWEHQPKEPSAGCTFKNPATCPAGKLIDQLGMKGARVGGALVSPIHGNFIVNDGGATARDILNLIEQIRQRARTEADIQLETEVEIVGED